ncbi:alpha/beta hydrolase, partial [Parabacteroides distasonis]|nr:alpha/beta hydrolase [Parabacteroides distasonis]
MMYGMQYIQQTIVGIDGSEARFFGYVADNSEEMEPDRIRPAILILPGGGYAMTSDREAEPVALQFLAKGFAVFVLRYSVQPSRYPVALLEAAEAMRLIRANADQW